MNQLFTRVWSEMMAKELDFILESSLGCKLDQDCEGIPEAQF